MHFHYWADRENNNCCITAKWKMVSPHGNILFFWSTVITIQKVKCHIYGRIQNNCICHLASVTGPNPSLKRKSFKPIATPKRWIWTNYIIDNCPSSFLYCCGNILCWPTCCWFDSKAKGCVNVLCLHNLSWISALMSQCWTGLYFNFIFWKVCWQVWVWLGQILAFLGRCINCKVRTKSVINFPFECFQGKI